MVVPQQGVVKIPDDVPYEIGALIGCGVTTGVGAALNTAKVQPGSNVVVFGAGGVGIAAIQGARIAGAAEIVAVDMIDSKLKDAKRFGATHGVKPDELDAANARDQPAARASTTPSSASASPSPSGPPTTPSGAAAPPSSSARADADAMVEFNCFELFFQEKKLLGSYYGSADVRIEFDRLIRLWKAGRLDLEGMISVAHGHLQGPGRLRRHEAGRDHPPDPHLLEATRAAVEPWRPAEHRDPGSGRGSPERYGDFDAVDDLSFTVGPRRARTRAEPLANGVVDHGPSQGSDHATVRASGCQGGDDGPEALGPIDRRSVLDGLLGRRPDAEHSSQARSDVTRSTRVDM